MPRTTSGLSLRPHMSLCFFAMPCLTRRFTPVFLYTIRVRVSFTLVSQTFWLVSMSRSDATVRMPESIVLFFLSQFPIPPRMTSDSIRTAEAESRYAFLDGWKVLSQVSGMLYVLTTGSYELCRESLISSHSFSSTGLEARS